jgi:hypothetical protein
MVDMTQAIENHFLNSYFASDFDPECTNYARVMPLKLEEIQNEVRQLKITQQLQLVEFLGNQLTMQIPNLEMAFSNDMVMKIRNGEWEILNADIDPLFTVQEDGMYMHPSHFKDFMFGMNEPEKQKEQA